MIWFLSLICFALPAYLIRFEIFGIPTTALEILIYGAVLLTAVKELKSERVKEKKYSITSSLHHSLTIPLVLLLLAAVISVIISPDKRVSLGILKGWILDPILLFGLIILNVKTIKDFKKIVYGLSGGAVIVSLWGILQAFGFSYLLPHQQTDPSFLSYLTAGRAFGPFESPNYLGMFIAPVASLTLGFWLKSKITNSQFLFTNNYFLSFVLCSMLLALLFTKSFGAWLGFGVALIFLVWFYLPKEKRSGFYAFLILAMIIFSALIFKYHPQRISDSFAARKEVWQVSWHLIKNHPILGIGLGTFPKIYNQTIPQIHFPPINWLQMHPHNIFLAFWLNLGLLGLLSFLWLLMRFFKRIKEHLTTGLRPYAICWTAAMLAILIHGLIDTTYWKNDLSAIFWIVFGLAFISSRKRQNENF